MSHRSIASNGRKCISWTKACIFLVYLSLSRWLKHSWETIFISVLPGGHTIRAGLVGRYQSRAGMRQSSWSGGFLSTKGANRKLKPGMLATILPSVRIVLLNWWVPIYINVHPYSFCTFLAEMLHEVPCVSIDDVRKKGGYCSWWVKNRERGKQETLTHTLLPRQRHYRTKVFALCGVALNLPWARKCINRFHGVSWFSLPCWFSTASSYWEILPMEKTPNETQRIPTSYYRTRSPPR